MIDDPNDALEKKFEIEEAFSDPVLPRLAKFADEFLPWPFDKMGRKVRDHLNADRVEKIELTLKVVRGELRGREEQLSALKNDVDRLTEWFSLALDGLKKAEQTRAKSRVERIGKILATSLTAVPAPDPDRVEEMMRVAQELSDQDVQLLNELVRVQGAVVSRTGRIPRYDAWQSWPNGVWHEEFDTNVESAFSKMESFGLVMRLAPPNNLTITADIQGRFALMKKGLEFIRFVRE